jgi:hypothetical protein
MSYDEEHQRRSRVVVETPTARREVVHSQTVRAPERAGYSAGMVAAVALAAIAATAIIFLFMMNRGEDRETSVNVSAGAQPTPYVQQPPAYAPQPAATQPTPLVIQQPPTVVTQPAPVVVPPATTTAPPATTTAPAAGSAPPPRESSASNDAALQANVDRAFSDDATLNSADITAVVLEGKVTLNGTVNSDELKQRAQRLAYSVRGVRSVDNRIVVTGN